MVKLQNIDLRYKFVVDLLQCLAEAYRYQQSLRNRAFKETNTKDQPYSLIKAESGLVWSGQTVLLMLRSHRSNKCHGVLPDLK